MLKKYYRINEAAGVSIHMQPDGATTISMCLVSTDGKKLDFIKKISGMTDVRLLGEQLPPKTVIALNLTGKGVLLKQTDHTEEINAGNFNKVLPNAVFDDFYVQQFKSGERSFVALIRKTDADTYIRQLTGLGFTVSMLSLGPYVVTHILPQLNFYGEEIVFDGHTITLDDKKKWAGYAYDKSNQAPFQLKVESEPITEEQVLAYAVAFQLLLHDRLEPVHTNAAEINSGLIALLANRKFKAEGAFILAVFFVLLLVNFITLSWLNSSNAKLLNQVGVSDQVNADMNSLIDKIATKEKLLAGLGWENSADKTVLVDQIASLLPDNVTIEKIDVNPFDKIKSEIRHQQIFSTRTITIEGNSQQIIPINEWIARIKTKPWVKNIQLVNYQVDQEKNTGKFNIKINY